MSEDENLPEEKSKTPWVIGGLIGAAALVGGTAWALSKSSPRSTTWFGFEIRVEDREVDDEQKPYRWTVSKDDKLIAGGLAANDAEAIDLAKSAIEVRQEAIAAGEAVAQAAGAVKNAVSGAA